MGGRGDEWKVVEDEVTTQLALVCTWLCNLCCDVGWLCKQKGDDERYHAMIVTHGVSAAMLGRIIVLTRVLHILIILCNREVICHYSFTLALNVLLHNFSMAQVL
ncbi:hypothetical protein COO60DRAFT_360992 [Scenedesmus sp. NREL 46B-D3]|nr:hypothetical protein COO60DRAFT_360992 [Scenedesmus sp. NREL 46B-D3]